MPLGWLGGDQERVAVVAVTLLTVMFSGGDSGTGVSPEPEEKSQDNPATHIRTEERQRDTNIVITLSPHQHYMDYQTDYTARS